MTQPAEPPPTTMQSYFITGDGSLWGGYGGDFSMGAQYGTRYSIISQFL